MIFGQTKLELKVGIFVFIGLTILVTFVLLIGDFRTWNTGHDINFTFGFVNGVKVGVPVRFAGVDIGKVKGIEFLCNPENRETRVKIVGYVNKSVKIPGDSTVWVNTLGLLGEKYIEIIPGKDYQHLVGAGQTIIGTDPIAMHEVTTLAKSIVDNIDETLTKIRNREGTLGKLLFDDSIYNDLEALMKDLRAHPWKLFFKTKDKN